MHKLHLWHPSVSEVDAEVARTSRRCTGTLPAARPARDAGLRDSRVDASIPQGRPWGPAGPAAVARASLGEPMCVRAKVATGARPRQRREAIAEKYDSIYIIAVSTRTLTPPTTGAD